MPRLNVILIVNDDTGYGELGCYGASDLQTPHLDALAASGIRLTHYYTSLPVCSPARASILTGRYPQRVGVTGVLRQQHDDTGLHVDEVTLAEVLRQNGYATGLVGKWHAGVGPGCRPLERGFDEFYGALNGVIDYWTHQSLGGGLDGQPGLYRGAEQQSEEGYFTDLITREALSFVDRHQAAPFFLMLQPPPPHMPLQAPDEWLDRFGHIEDPDRRTYAAMMGCLDDGLGRLFQRVGALGLREHTAILYCSDHGWVRHGRYGEVSHNGGLRGGKYYLTEGGLRVPAILDVPGWEPGVWDEPAIAMDWLPTICGLTGCPLPDRLLDGRDLCERGPRTFCWQFQDDLVGTGPQRAVQQWPWKLLDISGCTELFNLADDPCESQDLSADQPEIVEALEAAWSNWHADVSTG